MTPDDSLGKLKSFLGGSKKEPAPTMEEAMAEVNPYEKDGSSWADKIGMPKPAETAEPMPIYQYNIIIDSDHPNLKKAIVRDDGEIDIYVPEGIIVTEVIYNRLHKSIVAGKREFPAFQIVKIDVMPEEQRTCKWYTPSKHQMKKYGAVAAESYEFDGAFKVGTCSNPVVIKANGHPAPPCEYASSVFTQCAEYDSEALVVIKAAHDEESERTLELQVTRRNFGLKQYRVVENAKDGTVVYPEPWPITCDDPDIDWDDRVTQAWENCVEAELGIEPIDVTHKFNPETIKDSYFNHVLESTA